MCIVTTTGPNEALIVSGVGYGKNPKLIVSGRSFVFACIHTVCCVPLNTLTLVIDSNRVYTKQGVPVSVTGVAQVGWVLFDPLNTEDSIVLTKTSY